MKPTGNATTVSLQPCRNTLLADEFVLDTKTRNWRWNVNSSERYKP
jgi:hypothetical protein